MSAKRSFHHRLAIGGVLLAACGTAVYSATAIPAGDPSAPIFVPGTLAILAIAFAMSRTPKCLWFPVIGGPIALAVQVADPFRLLHPDSFIDFVPSVLIVAGSLIAFVASVVALRERHHGVERAGQRVERVLLGAAGFAIVAVAALSAVLTFGGTRMVALPDGREAVVVVADEDRWDPEIVSVPAGSDQLLLVRNPNWIAHSFTSADLDIDAYIAPRSERVFTIDARAPGTYAFVCNVTGHEMMVGRLRVS